MIEFRNFSEAIGRPAETIFEIDDVFLKPVVSDTGTTRHKREFGLTKPVISRRFSAINFFCNITGGISRRFECKITDYAVAKAPAIGKRRRVPQRETIRGSFIEYTVGREVLSEETDMIVRTQSLRAVFATKIVAKGVIREEPQTFHKILNVFFAERVMRGKVAILIRESHE